MIKQICEFCGKEFEEYPSDNRKFCNKECYWKSMKGLIPWNKGKKGLKFGKRLKLRIIKHCENCGINMNVHPKRKFCDRCKRQKKNNHAKEYQQRLEIKIKKKEYNEKHKEKNKERMKRYFKQRYQKNRENILKKQKEYYESHKNKLKPTLKQKEKKSIYNKKYREKNRDLIRIWSREHENKRKKEDKQYCLIHRLRNALLKALKIYTKTGKIMSSKDYGIDYKAIIEYLKPFPENLENYQIHHIKPLFTFKFINPDGSTNFLEVSKAFSPENHKWLTIEEHRKINHKELI